MPYIFSSFSFLALVFMFVAFPLGAAVFIGCIAVVLIGIVLILHFVLGPQLKRDYNDIMTETDEKLRNEKIRKYCHKYNQPNTFGKIHHETD